MDERGESAYGGTGLAKYDWLRREEDEAELEALGVWTWKRESSHMGGDSWPAEERTWARDCWT